MFNLTLYFSKDLEICGYNLHVGRQFGILFTTSRHNFRDCTRCIVGTGSHGYSHAQHCCYSFLYAQGNCR